MGLYHKRAEKTNKLINFIYFSKMKGFPYALLLLVFKALKVKIIILYAVKNTYFV